jgi:cell division protein ZapE
MSFIDHYHAKTATATLLPDAAQEAAAQALQALYAQLRGEAPQKKRWFGFGKSSVSATHGLYLWGDVGRGKSMLMDLFVEAVRPHFTTRRAHFHAFMLNVHERLFAFRQLGGGDPLPRVIAEIAGENRILCLDEMQVHDVADAMILSRLFAGLITAGTCVVFTSNRPPEALYQGGIQREQFVDFISMLRAQLSIVKLDGATDYRLQQHREIERSYMFPRNGASDDFLLQAWAWLTGNAPSEPLRIAVQGRILRVDKHARGVAWMTFAELCMRPLGAVDYLALIKQCHTLLLQGIPPLKAEDRNEAKRFVTLIDTLYDHRIKLIATAETAPEGIYAHGDGNFEFARTVSRLIEMQSDKYWALAKIG